MLTVKLSDPWEFPEMVRGFRDDICRYSGYNLHQGAPEALPYALYLFAFAGGGGASAVGMLEFFFFREARAHGCPVPSVLLQKILPAVAMKDVVHIGGLAVFDEEKESRVLLELCRAFVDIASGLGGRVMTAESSTENQHGAALQKRLELQVLGSFTPHGRDIELSYGEMAQARERIGIWDRETFALPCA